MLSTHVAAVVLVLLHGAAGALPHPPRASGRSAPRVLFAQPLTSRRDVLIGAAATLGAAVALLPAPRPASAASDGLVWRPLEQALAPSLRVGSGETYPPRFVAYLSRFLLKFDRLSRSWWESKASEVPKQFDQERVSELRLEHYAEFARSVELGLEAEYAGAQGVTQLVDLLRRQFTTQPERRQMAILLTLLPRRTQPVEDITKLLGETDNAQVRTIKVSDGGAGYDARNPPQVRITSPAASVAGGTAGVAAELRAVVVDGRVSSIEIRNQGKGYSYAQTLELIIAPPPPPLPKPVPREVLAPPLASDANASDVNASVALAEAVEVVVEPPRQAIASATLRPRDAFLRGPGSTWSGWLAKSATSVELLTLLPSDTPIAYDGARKCYQIQLAMVGGRSPAGADGGAPVAVAPLSPADIAVEAAREAAPSSGELLSTRRAYEVLDPIFGPIGRSPVEKQASLDASQFARLAFSGALCAALGHAILTPLEVVKTRVQADSTAFDGLGFFGAAKRIVRLEADAAAARAAASAPPADARVAEAADATPRGVGGAAADVAVDAPPILSAGLPALFRGIDASAFGHFVSGGISFGVTELCRRVFASALGPERMLLLPSPLTVVGASVVGICFATVGGAPFEATRVKMVSGGDAFAPNVAAGLSRLASEEGVSSFYGQKFRTLLLKDVPYAMVKFASFDAYQKLLYALEPALSESMSSALAVSLISGFLAGVSAATFSHPADTLFTKLGSRAKTTDGTPGLGPIATAREMVRTQGVKSLYAGVGTRAVLSGLLLAIEFLIYDYLRAALHVGPEDLQLYMDVLAGVQLE